MQWSSTSCEGAGVYVLVSAGLLHNEHPVRYVGQTRSLPQRLDDHKRLGVKCTRTLFASSGFRLESYFFCTTELESRQKELMTVYDLAWRHGINNVYGAQYCRVPHPPMDCCYIQKAIVSLRGLQMPFSPSTSPTSVPPPVLPPLTSATQVPPSCEGPAVYVLVSTAWVHNEQPKRYVGQTMNLAEDLKKHDRMADTCTRILFASGGCKLEYYSLCTTELESRETRFLKFHDAAWRYGINNVYDELYCTVPHTRTDCHHIQTAIASLGGLNYPASPPSTSSPPVPSPPMSATQVPRVDPTSSPTQAPPSEFAASYDRVREDALFGKYSDDALRMEKVGAAQNKVYFKDVLTKEPFLCVLLNERLKSTGPGNRWCYYGDKCACLNWILCRPNHELMHLSDFCRQKVMKARIVFLEDHTQTKDPHRR